MKVRKLRQQAAKQLRKKMKGTSREFVFIRTRELAKSSNFETTKSLAELAPMAGLVTSLYLPFPGPVLQGIRPPSSFGRR